MVCLTVLVVFAAFLSACFFQKQLTVMREQFEVTDRAWVKVTVTPNTDSVPGAVFGGALTFDANGDAHMNIRSDLKNVGRSAATSVRIRQRLIPVSPIFLDFKMPIRAQQELCHQPFSDAKNPWMRTIFPDDSKPDVAGMSVSTLDVKDAPKEIGASGGKPITFFYVGCVDYQSASSKSIHQTGFVYEVVTKSGQVINVGRNVPVDQLAFEEWFGGDYAN